MSNSKKINLSEAVTIAGWVLFVMGELLLAILYIKVRSDPLLILIMFILLSIAIVFSFHDKALDILKKIPDYPLLLSGIALLAFIYIFTKDLLVILVIFLLIIMYLYDKRSTKPRALRKFNQILEKNTKFHRNQENQENN